MVVISQKVLNAMSELEKDTLGASIVEVEKLEGLGFRV